MVRTVSLNAEIPENRELRITLPSDVPAGPAEIVVVVSSSFQENATTLEALCNSEFLGIWQDRSDISDSFEFARQLRSQGLRTAPYLSTEVGTQYSRLLDCRDGTEPKMSTLHFQH